ncbi:LysR family transcriptional regulator [Salmonella enterica subsp. enterica]
MVMMETRNFSKAAEILCITRSPLSKVVTEIEESLGGKLFCRKHNELEPTDLALSYYERCRSLYGSLLSLENEHKTHNNARKITLKADISVPEGLVRLMEKIIKSEMPNIDIKREMITVSDLSSLDNNPDVIIMSLRPLGGADLVCCDSWEGGKIVKIQTSSPFDKTTTDKIFIWKDKYMTYFKKRLTHVLNLNESSADFFEHNFDVATLLYMIREGKGVAVVSEKLVHMFKMDGIKWEGLDNIHIKNFLYYNNSRTIGNDVQKIKELISKFV